MNDATTMNGPDAPDVKKRGCASVPLILSRVAVDDQAEAWCRALAADHVERLLRATAAEGVPGECDDKRRKSSESSE